MVWCQLGMQYFLQSDSLSLYTCFGVVMALTHRLVPSFYEMASVQMGQNWTKDFCCKKKININTAINETSCIIMP